MKKENTDKVERQSAAAAERSEAAKQTEATGHTSPASADLKDKEVEKYPPSDVKDVNYKNQEEYISVHPNKKAGL